MPRFHKWLTGVQPDAPADEVARAALAERLLAVSHFLDKSIGDSDETEAIHQLRVWTRRAAAAIDLFNPALPKHQRQRISKHLRKMRKRGGAVRDCDMHLQRLQQEDADVPRRVVRALKKSRREARSRLKELRRRLFKDDRFPIEIEKLLKAIAWPKRHSSRKPPPFSPFCQRQLTPLAAEFFRLAEADLRDDETLHALRIAGKRLRYALELAPAAMPAAAHQQFYEALDQIQDELGEVVDQIAAIAQLRDSLDLLEKKSHRQKLQRLVSRGERRLSRLRAKVLRGWSPARRKYLHKLGQKARSPAS